MTTDNARSRMSGERNMTLADYPRQRRAAARYHDAKLRLTHVVVGDHQPEPRGIVCQMGLNGKCVACGEDD